jgi:hypothetical protein
MKVSKSCFRRNAFIYRNILYFYILEFAVLLLIYILTNQDFTLYSETCIRRNPAWDRKYFQHWTNFRIIQNK